jgi:hypothetical protein
LVAQEKDFGILGRLATDEQADPLDDRAQDQVEQSQCHESAIMPDRLCEGMTRPDRVDEVLGTHRLQ